MNKHRVLYVVESRVVLKSMLPAMLETRRQGIAVDVYVFDFGEMHLYYSLLKEAADYITELGFDVLRTIPEHRKYDVVYSAYPGNYQELAVKNQIRYNVRFTYQLAGAHIPSASYSQDLYNYYDFIVCLGEPDAKIMSGHAKTVSIGNIKLADYKRTRETPEGRKTVLYLPTWGADNRNGSINVSIINKLIELQDKYKIIAKMHSAMQHFENQLEYRKLVSMLDTVYDTNTPITDLLNEADVVLSDISSVAFDAVAGDVPLALFGLGEPVYFGGKLCLHQQLVQDDIIPGTNDLDELETVIKKALTPRYFAKEQKLKRELFLYEGRECVDAFMSFQNNLFEDCVDPWYIATRKAIRENYIKERLEIQVKMDAMMSELIQKQAETDRVYGVLTQTQEFLAQSKRQLAQTQIELTQTHGSLNQAHNALTQTREVLIETQGELEQTRAELIQTHGALTQTREVLIETQGELGQRQAELTRTYAVLTQTRETLGKIQQELATQKVMRAKLASQVIAMENTKVWKITKSLRKLYGLMIRK